MHAALNTFYCQSSCHFMNELTSNLRLYKQKDNNSIVFGNECQLIGISSHLAKASNTLVS